MFQYKRRTFYFPETRSAVSDGIIETETAEEVSLPSSGKL